MKIIADPSVKSYAEKVEKVLIKKEACNNLILGILNRLKTTSIDCYLGYVEEDGCVVSAFLQTPPHNWIIADIEAVNPNIAYAIADHIYEKGMEAPGVIGPNAAAEKFAERWTARRKTNACIHMNQLIYQLHDVKIKPSDEGRLVKATEQELDLIAGWLVLFGKEANEIAVADRAENLAHQFVKNGSVYLWKEKNQFVSMANMSRKTKHGAAINAVFTPDENKRKGYATSTVAALSQNLLDEGFQFCCLYTDQTNPTSNNIYQKIGYRIVGSSIVYHFGKAI
jgi:hypothetical protein